MDKPLINPIFMACVPLRISYIGETILVYYRPDCLAIFLNASFRFFWKDIEGRQKNFGVFLIFYGDLIFEQKPIFNPSFSSLVILTLIHNGHQLRPEKFIKKVGLEIVLLILKLLRHHILLSHRQRIHYDSRLRSSCTTICMLESDIKNNGKIKNFQKNLMHRHNHSYSTVTPC